MTTVNPNDSVARATSVDRWRGSGLCLDFVDWAMGRPGSRLGNNGGPPNGAWTEAKDGYYYSNLKHPGDQNPPAGVPCYWETGPSGNTAGHIVISLGGGWCRTTDYAGAASVSTQTIDSITNARRGGYLGWTEDYGGNPIAGITGSDWAGGPPTPINPEQTELEYLMTVADDIVADIKARILESEARIKTDTVAQIAVAISAALEQGKIATRREGRGRLLFDAGPDGKTAQEQSTRAVVIKIHTGYIYPLNPDPMARQGQLASVRATPYLQIDKDEKFEGLPTQQFDNEIEMANTHLRRIALEVVRQLSLTEDELEREVAAWPLVAATVRDGIFPARGLAGYEPQITPATGDHAA